jgi:predicted GIY-YIG superfamily endonuclease
MSEHQYCYIVYSPSKNRTYVGYTVNPTRRIRQHNGFIKGGAKATSIANDWRFLSIITSSADTFTNILALSIEWHLKHPTGQKRTKDAIYRGIEGRLHSIVDVLNRYSIDFTVYIDQNYREKLDGLRDLAENKKDLSNPTTNVINIKLLDEIIINGLPWSAKFKPPLGGLNFGI